MMVLKCRNYINVQLSQDSLRFISTHCVAFLPQYTFEAYGDYSNRVSRM